MLAAKGVVDERGVLWVGYASGLGPSGIATGAVWRYEADGRGRDVTPTAWRETGAEGAFLGVSVSRMTPGTVAVTTVDRYRHGDSLWISRDDGRNWDDVGPRSRRNVSETPFLLHEGKGADFGHWISGLAIDPFDPAHIAYTTGATVYATHGVSSTNVNWTPWTKGIEQTAVITLASPTGGAPLISGFGDLAGFVHDNLDRSPQPTFINPYMSNTNNIDYAGLTPNVIVRSGSLYLDRPREASMGRSEDGGRTWTMVKLPPMGDPAKREDLNGDWPITVSADGATMVVATPVPQVSRDRGHSWSVVRGLPGRTHAVADKRDPRLFYAVDVDRGRVLVSRDVAASFAPVAARGLPAGLSRGGRQDREAQSALVADPSRTGTLWLQAGERLLLSTGQRQPPCRTLRARQERPVRGRNARRHSRCVAIGRPRGKLVAHRRRRASLGCTVPCHLGRSPVRRPRLYRYGRSRPVLRRPRGGSMSPQGIVPAGMDVAQPALGRDTRILRI
jgi:xyloglucan-specific exo-beta-1,4-glucanase